jgi:hypothetical protein
MTNKQEEIVVEVLTWISVIVIVTSITLIIIL